MGADMKWLPRGVGKWSLSGESQSAFFGDLVLGDLLLEDLSRPLRMSINDPRFDSSSSSNIVLSDRRRLWSCPADGGLYVVDGRKSNVPILSIQSTPYEKKMLRP